MDHPILDHDCLEQAKFRHRNTFLSIEKVASERVLFFPVGHEENHPKKPVF